MTVNVPDDLLDCWAIGNPLFREDMNGGGSPSRVQARYVFEADGVRYVLECLPPQKKLGRIRQGRILDALREGGNGLVLPWQRTVTGEYGVMMSGWYWQLRRWLDTEDLPRDTYGNDGWRGRVMADFLGSLHGFSLGGECGSVFNLSAYIKRLMHLIGHSNPNLHEDLSGILSEMGDISEFERALPVGFCHGDFHPLNVLWGAGQSINAVIDWEFCGLKPALYDAANLLGCLGNDNPEFLTGDMARSFLGRLQELGAISTAELLALPKYIAAQRFAWMREWFILNNTEMMVQEMDFIWLLLDNVPLLQRKFTARQ